MASLGQLAVGLSRSCPECPPSAHLLKGSLHLTPASSFPFLPPPPQFLSSPLGPVLTCLQPEEKTLCLSGGQGKGTGARAAGAPAQAAGHRPRPRPTHSPLPPQWKGPGPRTFSRSTLPRSFSRQLIMTVAAREQFLSGSPSPSNMVSKRLMSCSGGRRFAMI